MRSRGQQTLAAAADSGVALETFFLTPPNCLNVNDDSAAPAPHVHARIKYDRYGRGWDGCDASPSNASNASCACARVPWRV